MFPKVTYNRLEFFLFHEIESKDSFLMEMDTDYAMASSKNIIWLTHLSIKWLLHEFLHIVGWKMKMPLLWHILIHKIL